MEGNVLDYNEERIRNVEAEIEDAMLEAGKARQADDLETWRLWVSKATLLRTKRIQFMEERLTYLREHLPYFPSQATGAQPAEPALQGFWNQLAATEKLHTFDSTRVLDLGSNAHFPQEGSDVQGRLLVRRCYEDLNQMIHYHFVGHSSVFIVIGTPGMGKTHFLYFLMWQLARSGKTVVWDKQNAELAVMFGPLGIFQGPLQAFRANLDNPDTWYLVDGKPPLRCYAKTVLVTSPDWNIYKEAHKWPNSMMRHMGPWSYTEILAACNNIYNDQPIADVKSRFSKWGCNPRFVFQYIDAASQALLKDELDAFSPENLSDCMRLSNMSTSAPAFDTGNKILHLTTKGDYFKGPLVFASEWVREELISQFLRLGEHEVRDFREKNWDWGQPELLSFRRALRERQRASHG